MIRNNLLPILLICSRLLLGQDFTWPTDASRALSSNFGEFRSDHFHMGLDIKTNGRVGYLIYAVADGHISRMVTNFLGYGKALYLTTSDGNIAVYGHLDRFMPLLEEVLKVQQERAGSYHVNQYFTLTEFPVQKGDVIGYTGNSGASFAPHLHFEFRNGNNQPLNPLSHGFSLPDHLSPVLMEIAVIPLATGTMINANPLPQTFPLFRDQSGLYNFSDTINCQGSIGFAIRAIDKRQGATNKYQFHRAELRVDGTIEYSITYDLLDYDQSAVVKTIYNHRLSRLNLGEFHNLYRLEDYPLATIQKEVKGGVLNLIPGYHTIEINIWDAAGNISTAKGIVFVNPPVRMAVQKTALINDEISFSVKPAFGAIPIESVTCYSFTPYGYADEQIDILRQEPEGKGLTIHLSRKKADRHILQFIGINKLGAFAYPVHWAGSKSYGDILDAKVDLKLSHLETGLFLQVETDAYLDTEISARLGGRETAESIPLMQVQPTVYLSQLIHSDRFAYTAQIEVIIQGQIDREIYFKIAPKLAIPGKSTSVLSKDQLCSILTTTNSLFDTTVLWIDAVKKTAPVPQGKLLSKVYQLQPFEIPLKDTIQVGIRYRDELAFEDHLGIYYYDNKKKTWIYLPTTNRANRRVLTTSISSLEALAILQDETPPTVETTFPANGGNYQYQDIELLKATLNDNLSGIEPNEEGLSMQLDGKRLLAAYQPIKKELSYRLSVPLEEGRHEIVITIKDQAGNSTVKKIKFSVN